MIQLRGLGETDCDPKTDAVCAEFYDLPPPVKRLYGSPTLINRVLATLPKPGAAAGDGTPLVPAVPAALLPVASWWSSQSVLVKALLVGGGAFVAYKGYQRYVAR